MSPSTLSSQPHPLFIANYLSISLPGCLISIFNLAGVKLNSDSTLLKNLLWPTSPHLSKCQPLVVQTKNVGIMLESLSLTTHGQDSRQIFAHYMDEIGQISAATHTPPGPGGAGCMSLLPSPPSFWNRVREERWRGWESLRGKAGWHFWGRASRLWQGEQKGPFILPSGPRLPTAICPVVRLIAQWRITKIPDET